MELPAAALPPNEAERCLELASYEVLGTAPDARIDDLVLTASDLFQVPMSALSLVAPDRQWFKASVGFATTEMPREQAFCAHAILEPEQVLVVEDASRDRRFHDNPLVTGGQRIRFYAGAPVLSAAGLPLGTLCVAGPAPRMLDAIGRERLRRLASGAGVALELHRSQLRLERAGAAQRQTVQLLAKVFGATDVAIAILREDQHIMITTPHFNREVGYSAAETIGRFFPEMLAPPSRLGVVEALYRQRSDGREIELRCQALRRDGQECAVRLTAILVHQEGSSLMHIVTLRPVEPLAIMALEKSILVGPRPQAAIAPPETLAPGTTLRVAGKLRMIGLQETRDALGPRWAQLARKALDTAEQVLRRRLEAGDTWARGENESFIVCFGHANEEQASFRAATIAREIRTRLMREGEDSATSRVDSIARAIDVPSDMAAAGEAGEGPPPALSSLLDLRLEQRRSVAEADARNFLIEMLTLGDCRFIPATAQKEDRPSAYHAALPPGVEERAAICLATLPQEETDHLDVDTMLLSLVGDTPPPDGAAVLVVNVSLDLVLSSSRFRRYAQACSKLDPGLRRRLVLSLSGAPAGMPVVRIEDTMQRLRPLCHSVALDLQEPELPPVGLGHVPIFTVAAERLMQGGAIRPTRARKFTELMSSRRARLLVHHLPSEAVAVRLRTAGIGLVAHE